MLASSQGPRQAACIWRRVYAHIWAFFKGFRWRTSFSTSISFLIRNIYKDPACMYAHRRMLPQDTCGRAGRSGSGSSRPTLRPAADIATTTHDEPLIGCPALLPRQPYSATGSPCRESPASTNSCIYPVEAMMDQVGASERRRIHRVDGKHKAASSRLLLCQSPHQQTVACTRVLASRGHDGTSRYVQETPNHACFSMSIAASANCCIHPRLG